MHFRPGLDVPFFFIEAVLIGAHYAFPDLPHLLGQVMFYGGILGLVVWILLKIGLFDSALQRWFGPLIGSRDVGISEAAAYVCLREWGKTFMDAAKAPDTDANAALQELRQAAADGRVTIWGKKARYNVYEQIPAEYWLNYQVEWFGLLRGENTATEPAVAGVKRGDEYFDMMMSRSQVADMWPKKKRLMRLRKPWEWKTGA